MSPSPPAAPERFHALDALRAFALLLGVCLHAAIAFIDPPTRWAVGTATPATIPALFAYYVHCFRMEIFFLLAGFFARLVIGKRGVPAFLRDRAVRIVLVFLVALYPMKLLLSACWIVGMAQTGTLHLPPEAAGLPLWQLALGSFGLESWPRINLTHLWFLYYLASVTALFLVVHRLGSLVVPPAHAARRMLHKLFRRVAASWLAPIALPLLTVPLLGAMSGFDIDTPDTGFVWHGPVLTLYGLFFALGWLLHRHQDLLATFARRWAVYLPLSLAVGYVSARGLGLRMEGGTWAGAHATSLRWATVCGTSLTMALAVPGWIGLFVRFFDRHRSWVRYLADSSYWVYLVHLPLVVALQIAFFHWAAPWSIQWPLINAIAFPVLFLSYHVLVRTTWIGAWINGRRPVSIPLSRTTTAPVSLPLAGD